MEENWNAGCGQANWPNYWRKRRSYDKDSAKTSFYNYCIACGVGWRGPGSAERVFEPAVELAEIHEMLTLLPGRDYPIEEFARDSLLLDRRPDLRTRDGYRFQLPASTLSKGRMRRLVVDDERGVEHTYVAIRFVQGG